MPIDFTGEGRLTPGIEEVCVHGQDAPRSKRKFTDIGLSWVRDFERELRNRDAACGTGTIDCILHVALVICRINGHTIPALGEANSGHECATSACRRGS